MVETRARLTRLIERLVSRPEAVQVRALPLGRVTEFQVRVAPEDLGPLIGRKGRTARAMRALLSARGERLGERFELKILEDD
jgi:predicted RNA-binding protein YlqC (UPF0109 family)